MRSDAPSATGAVVIGVDGSPASLEALRTGATIARAFDAPLLAIAAWQYPVAVAGMMPLAGWSPEADASAILDEAVETVFAGSPPSELHRAVVAGPAAPELIRRSDSATMIVVGSRGHGGVAGLLLGSVSTAVAQHARCPVLVVHSAADSRARRRSHESAAAPLPLVEP